MRKLLAGEQVELPYYNFKKGVREYKGDFMRLGPTDILVIEGIHCLNEKMSHALPKESKFKIYISALTQLNIDEHNRIPTTDGRLLRRMVRDARTRGNPAREEAGRPTGDQNQGAGNRPRPASLDGPEPHSWPPSMAVYSTHLRSWIYPPQNGPYRVQP